MAKTEIVKTEGELSQAQIEEWKAKYGHVYKTASGKQAIVYHSVNRKDYEQMMEDTEISVEDEQDEKKRLERVRNRKLAMIQLSVLYPENIMELVDEFAGLSDSLTDDIMVHSGFNALAETEEL